MKTKNTTRSRDVLTMGLTTGAFLASIFAGFSADAKPDRAAFKAAAVACGLPKPGEGRPTEEQKACMAKAGFSRPEGAPGEHHRGRHHHEDDGDAAPPTSLEEGSKPTTSANESSTAR